MQPQSNRVCQKCHQDLPRSAYDRYFLNGKPKGWHYICRECRAESALRLIAHPNPDDPSGDTVLVKLSKGKMAVIDAIDAERVLTRRWSATQTCPPNGPWYALSLIDGRFVYLHRYLLCIKDPTIEVDHIDGDGLNCRRSNMRLVNSQQNKWNVGLLSTNRSGYKGVYFRRDTGKWAATFSDNNRNSTLGSFNTAEEAAIAYDTHVRGIAGEHGRYNFPHEGEHPIHPPVDTSLAHIEESEPRP
jgi:hypothetical protein